jgi:Uma2 family endonuclease
MSPKTKTVSLEEFLEMDKGENRFEYFNGEVISLPSPSVEHQQVLLNIATEFRNYFRDKPCEAVISPLDVWLKNEEKALNVKVHPDLMVICDKAGLRESAYYGVPILIIEIISPSNQSHDRIRKYNTYMEFGVKEYWIVNPKLKTIEVYILKEGEYKQNGVYNGCNSAVSPSFDELEIHLREVFSE